MENTHLDSICAIFAQLASREELSARHPSAPSVTIGQMAWVVEDAKLELARLGRWEQLTVSPQKAIGDIGYRLQATAEG